MMWFLWSLTAAVVLFFGAMIVSLFRMRHEVSGAWVAIAAEVALAMVGLAVIWGVAARFV